MCKENPHWCDMRDFLFCTYPIYSKKLVCFHCVVLRKLKLAGASNFCDSITFFCHIIPWCRSLNEKPVVESWLDQTGSCFSHTGMNVAHSIPGCGSCFFDGGEKYSQPPCTMGSRGKNTGRRKKPAPSFIGPPTKLAGYVEGSLAESDWPGWEMCTANGDSSSGKLRNKGANLCLLSD